MAVRAICVRCGKPKKRPLVSCGACGFFPETEYQMGRALILSRAQTVGGVSVGRDAQALKDLSAQIQGGRPYHFDPQEEQRAVEAYRALRAENDRKRARRRAAAWAIVVLALIVAGVALASARFSA